MEEGQAGQGAGAKECADFACAPNVFEDLCRALQIVGSNFYERSTPHSAWLLVTTRTWFRAGFEVALSLTESFSQPPLCSLKGPCTVYPMRRAHPFLRRHLPDDPLFQAYSSSESDVRCGRGRRRDKQQTTNTASEHPPSPSLSSANSTT